MGSAPLHTHRTFYTSTCTHRHIYASQRVEELMSMAANSKPNNWAKVFSLILMCTVHAKTPRLCHEGPFKEHCCSNDQETHVNSTSYPSIIVSVPTPILLFVPIKKPTGRIAIHSVLLYGLMYTTKCQYIEANLWLNVFESQRNSQISPLPLLRRASLCYLHMLTFICAFRRPFCTCSSSQSEEIVNQINLNERLSSQIQLFILIIIIIIVGTCEDFFFTICILR